MTGKDERTIRRIEPGATVGLYSPRVILSLVKVLNGLRQVFFLKKTRVGIGLVRPIRK